ncbi:MAG: hypothetical protein U1E73_04265 [Planctomycetota bacterium]
MTLPQDQVMQFLDDNFVLGTSNIEKQEHVGISHGYKPCQTAVGTTNGAGGRNVQMVVLAADDTVIHVLPGFWHADDLIAELTFATKLHELYRDETRAPESRDAMFAAMHRAFVRRQSPETLGRSRWQGFDVWYEMNRSKSEARDVFLLGDDGQPLAGENGQFQVKPICQLVHDRMAQQPFRKLADFDMESFVDYGQPFYDNNQGLDKGRNFPRAVAANKKRELDQAKERKKLDAASN